MTAPVRVLRAAAGRKKKTTPKKRAPALRPGSMRTLSIGVWSKRLPRRYRTGHRTSHRGPSDRTSGAIPDLAAPRTAVHGRAGYRSRSCDDRHQLLPCQPTIVTECQCLSAARLSSRCIHSPGMPVAAWTGTQLGTFIDVPHLIDYLASLEASGPGSMIRIIFV